MWFWPRPEPGQAFSHLSHLCYRFRYYLPGGRGEWDALLAVEQHNFNYIWTLFEVCYVSPCIWQDGVLNLLHLFWFFYPPVAWSCALNGNQCQQDKFLLVFLITFAQSMDYRSATLNHLGACQKCRISSSIPDLLNQNLRFTRNQAIPTLWMSHSKNLKHLLWL